MKTMLTPELERALRALIEANRTQALWSLPLDYFPPDVAAACRVVERIAARGDRETFVRARLLLSRLGSDCSVATPSK